MPEDTQAPLILLDILDRMDSVVHSQVLMVLGQDLVCAAGYLVKEDEVLGQVEQLLRIACAPDHGLQGDYAHLSFFVDPLPF